MALPFDRSHDPGPQSQPATSSSLSVLSSSEPIILTWGADEVHEETHQYLGLRQEASRLSPVMPSENSGQVSMPLFIEPSEPPPSYSVARIPEYPVTYTFSRLANSSSAMLLIPPASSPDTRPIYHISVGQDPFMPACSITSVVRGGDENGPSVGGFKTITGIGNLQSTAETVWIRDCEHHLRSIFTIAKSKNGQRTFQWYSFNTKRSLVWSCPTWPQVGTYSCHRPANDTQNLAQFTPVNQLLRRGTTPDEIKLKVMPDGNPMFDDILLSVLLLERHRLTEVYTIPHHRQY